MNCIGLKNAYKKMSFPKKRIFYNFLLLKFIPLLENFQMQVVVLYDEQKHFVSLACVLSQASQVVTAHFLFYV